MTFGPGSFRMRNSYCLLQLLPFSVLFLHGFGFCFVSLVVQLVKNPPAMQETWVPSLGWEDPRKKADMIARLSLSLFSMLGKPGNAN